MSFKTAAEMFGDGGGFGPAVPYSVANPPGTSAGNRGIQFGEQLTASIANRTHYALALNDENLNTRLASWEASGLDAAYDLGALAVPGGGRLVNLTGGAVETISAHATQYAQDISNAHFRANASSDSSKGGGGFDFASYSQTGTASAAYGYLDRRSVVTASARTTIADLVAATLNPGGGSPDVVSLSAGFFKDGGNLTDLSLKYDLLEIEGPTHTGLYIIRSLPSTTTAVLRRLDGTAPAFGANVATTVRFYRPAFGTFSPFAGPDYRGVTIMGVPGQTAALDIIAGTQAGTRDATAAASGAKYALTVRCRTTAGTVFDTLGIESTGQISVATSIALLSAADQTAGVSFGVPAVASTSPGTSRYESNFVALNSGTQPAHFGFVNAEAMHGAAFSDPINFTFDVVSGDLILTGADGIAAANGYLVPGLSLLEILTPALNAGIYRVSALDTVGTGGVSLTDLGAAASGLPTVGGGTCRLLTTANLGVRALSFPNVAPTKNATPRVTAQIGGPGETGSAALVLHNSGQVASDLIRGMASRNADANEMFYFDSGGQGWVDQSMTVENGEFFYSPYRTKTVVVDLAEGRPSEVGGVGWSHVCTTNIAWNETVVGKTLCFPLNDYLRDGMVVTDIRVAMKPGGAARATPCAVDFMHHDPDFATFLATAPTSIALASDDNTGANQVISLAGALGAGHTVIRNTGARGYILRITGGTVLGLGDEIFGIKITFRDFGPRN